MLTGLNHLTLAVRELAPSLVFYEGVLGLRLHARWNRGAYLTLGDLWLCLSRDDQPEPARGYTHYAFSVAPADFPAFSHRLRQHGIKEWRSNASEGDSIYFLDPDGHRLEAHAGNLASRLARCRALPYSGMVFFD
jgi:catechol 2,3-dioxygenase-like lactoylglutathione lyase family enzyme